MDDNPWTGLMMICLVVIVIIVICCSPASAAECRLVGKPEPTPWEPDPEDVAYISRTIWGECRGCCEEEQRAQAWCILNRVDDPRFPGTLEGVLTAPGQYGRFSKTGIVWPSRSSNPGEEHAVQRAYDIARALLSGEHSDLYDQGYIWQAEFSQGKDVIYETGLYFGR